MNHIFFFTQRRKCNGIAKCNFSKITEIKLLNVPAPRKIDYSEHSIAKVFIPFQWWVMKPWDWFSFVAYIPCPGGEQFLWFFILVCDVTAFFVPFWHKQTFFLHISLIKSTIAYLCPKKINFDAVVLVIKCRSEEVS